MSEHLSTEAIKQYRGRSLPASELLAASDHLASCELCRQQATAAIEAPTILSSLRANLRVKAAGEAHLSYDQIAGFVDGQLNDSNRELVESHLENCALCSDEVSDLRSFRGTIVQPAKETTTPKPGIRQRLGSFWESVSWNPRFATVSAIALLLVFATAALILVWRMRSPAGTEVTEVTNVPSPGPGISPQTSSSANNADVAKDENANIEIALNDAGERITMDKQGNIVGLDALSPSMKSHVSRALKAERVESSRDLSELTGGAGVLLGTQDKGPDVLLNPVGIVLREDRPRFRWHPVAGANSYTVSVLDSDFNILATSPALTATSWSPSSTLPRGKVLSWQLMAVKDGEKVVIPAAPAPEAKFRILETEEERELSHAERTKPRSHLALGVLYARSGLLDDAERELRSLVAANPESATARKLLRSIQTVKAQKTKRR